MGNLIDSSKKCPECGSSRGYAIYDTNEYCFSCGFYKSKIKNFNFDYKTKVWDGTLPTLTTEQPIEVEQYIDKYKIKDICYYNKEEDRIIFPVKYKNEIKCYQSRSLNREPKWLTKSFKYPWGKKFPSVYINKKGSVVITEDIISTYNIHRAGYNSIALLGCKVNKFLINFLLDLSDVFVLWMDGDSAGIKASKLLLQILSKCATVYEVRSKKDPKEYTKEEIRRYINEKTG